MPGDNQNKTTTFQNPPQVDTPPATQGGSSALSTTDPSQPPIQVNPQDEPPQLGNQTPSASPSQQEAATLPSQSASPADVIQPTVTAPHAPKKYGGKKVIATIFGVLLLIGGVAAGVFLVQRQQLLEQQAASGVKVIGNFTVPQCGAEVKVVNDPPSLHQGTKVELKSSAGTLYLEDVEATAYKETSVIVPGDWVGLNVQVTAIPGPDNRHSIIWSDIEIECPEATPTPTPAPTNSPTPQPTFPPEVTADCNDVVAYDADGNKLTVSDLSQLDAGDIVTFAVSGTASSGTFDKARFAVNGTSLGETTQKTPGSEEFYVEYTIPTGTTTFTVKGEVFHSELGWI